jgi:HK97 family phage portal protein
MNLKKIFKRNHEEPYTNYVNNRMPLLLNKQSMLNFSTVYRSVDILSNSVAQLPMFPYISVNGEKKIMRQHPTYKLLAHSPNRRMSRFTFLKQIVVDILMHGNAFVYIERDETNEVT